MERLNPEELAAREAERAEKLLPARSLLLNGETITVQPFNTGQTFRLWPIAKPIIEALQKVFDEAGESLSFSEFMLPASLYPDEYLALLSESCGKDKAWIEALPHADGMLLFSTFWSVQQDFFSVALRLNREVRIPRDPRSAYSKFSQRSPGTATDLQS